MAVPLRPVRPAAVFPSSPAPAPRPAHAAVSSAATPARSPSFTYGAAVAASGCAALKTTPDPLAGWKFCYSENPVRSNKAILDDYQDYIQKLPSEKRSFFSGTDMYEDGTGQHR